MLDRQSIKRKCHVAVTCFVFALLYSVIDFASTSKHFLNDNSDDNWCRTTDGNL